MFWYFYVLTLYRETNKYYQDTKIISMKTIKEYNQNEKQILISRLMQDYDKLQQRIKEKEKQIQLILNS